VVPSVNAAKDASSTSASGTGSDNTIAASSVHDMGSVSSSHAVLLSSQDVMPENGRRMFGKTHRAAYESRIAQYRRKRKRERKRKIIALLFLLIAMIVVLVSYCAMYNPALLESVQKSVETYIDDFMAPSNLEKTIPDDISETLPRSFNAQVINPFLFEFEQNVIAGVQDINPSDAIKACDADEAAALAAAEKEAERRRLEEQQHREMMHRPWACNLPFAYIVHSRCNRLAKQNPVFDLQELILSMFQ
jgi:hypothetical protein